jgi:hypothetical protein
MVKSGQIWLNLVRKDGKKKHGKKKHGQCVMTWWPRQQGGRLRSRTHHFVMATIDEAKMMTTTLRVS